MKSHIGVYKTKEDAIFPMVVNFGVAIFMLAEVAAGYAPWLLFMIPINFGIGIVILVKNLDLFVGTRKEDAGALEKTK